MRIEMQRKERGMGAGVGGGRGRKSREGGREVDSVGS